LRSFVSAFSASDVGVFKSLARPLAGTDGDIIARVTATDPQTAQDKCPPSANASKAFED
jgi:hypothetical protein